MTKYKTGWRPSKASKDDWKWSSNTKALLEKRKVDSIVSDYDLEPLIPWILNQKSISSCGPHAVLIEMTIWDILHGYKPVRYSEPFLYYWARRYKNFLNTYRDNGVYPRIMLDAFRKVGVPLRDYWNKKESIRKRPDPLAIRRAISKKLKQYWLAKDALEIKQAMLSKNVVCIGLELDKNFYGINSDMPWERTGKVKGRHYMGFVGWRTNNDGTEDWKLINSWGKDWGLKGYCWITEKARQSGGDQYILGGWK